MPYKPQILKTYDPPPKEDRPSALADTPAKRFRAKKSWRKYSVALRSKFPLCQGLDCNKASAEVHHIESLELNIGLGMCTMNTIPLCVNCHRKFEGRTPDEVVQAWREKCQN